MDARAPVTRVGKAAAFFRPDRDTDYRAFAWPWRRDAAPYYLVEGVENADGLGGYARTCRFDADGVPYRRSPDGTPVYHPLVIARFILRMCSLAALTGADNAALAALRATAALRSSACATGTWHPAHAPHAMGGGAPSSIVQASIVSALARVWRIDPGVVARRTIDDVIDALIAPVPAGTVTCGLGGPFFEEFESRSHVLNGCIYGLWAIYDAIDGLQRTDLVPLAEAVESCLARTLARFTTTDGWSRYALDTYGYAPLASLHYHQSHIRMVTLLHERTARPEYAAAVHCWNAARESRAIRCAVMARKCLQAVWMRDVRRLPLVGSIWG